MAPEPLADYHELSAFNSGVLPLDDWLKRRARGNQASGATRTFVLAEGNRVFGYYAIATGGIAHAGAIGKFRRNMPDPIPVILLGRLAVDREWQRRGFAIGLLRDCAIRVARIADDVGIRGILVHAISEQAKGFYERHGFEPSPLDQMTLMVTLNDIRVNLVTQ